MISRSGVEYSKHVHDFPDILRNEDAYVSRLLKGHFVLPFNIFLRIYNLMYFLNLVAKRMLMQTPVFWYISMLKICSIKILGTRFTGSAIYACSLKIARRRESFAILYKILP